MSFLENYEILKKSIPVPAVRVTDNQNCQLVDYTHRSKNCYHCFVSIQLENSAYCNFSGLAHELFDCNYCGWSELLYESVECIKCYNSTYLKDCTSCRDCHFCALCVNCHDCFGCVALSHKQYCFFNRQYSKKEYQEKIKELEKEKPDKNLEKLQELIKKTPYPQSFQRNNVNCPYGDYLTNSKNVYWGFNTYWIENSGYIFSGGGARNCWDMTFSGAGGKINKSDPGAEIGTELCYQLVGGSSNHHCAFCEYCRQLTNCYYCSSCRYCSDCFGCVGLDNKKYCYLNNQLTKNEYKRVVLAVKKELGWKV